MHGSEEYSDDDRSVISDSESSSKTSGVLGALISGAKSLTSSVANAVAFLGNPSSTQQSEPMDSNGNSKPPLRPGRQQFNIYKSKNERTVEEDTNRANLRKVIRPQTSATVAKLPTMTAGARGPCSTSSALSDGLLFTGGKTSSTPCRSPGPPALSNPAEDSPSPRKCTVGNCNGTIGQNNMCIQCHRCQNPEPPLYNRPYAIKPNGPTPPRLEIVNHFAENRNPKRPHSPDSSDVEEVRPPPVLKEEILSETPPKQWIKVTIPETPPKELIPEEFILEVDQVYLGNIPCELKDLKITQEHLNLGGITPGPGAKKKDGGKMKFNIKVPFSEIKTVLHFTQTKGTKETPEGVYLYIQHDRQSADTIMKTLRGQLVDGHWLMDPDSTFESVKFLFVRCKSQANVYKFFTFIRKNAAVTGFNSGANQSLFYSITTNAYNRQKNEQAKSLSNRIAQRGGYSRNATYSASTATRSTPNTPVVKSIPPRTRKQQTSVEVVDLDDYDDDDVEVDENKRATRKGQTATVDPDVKPDEMLFVYPPNDPAFQVQIYGRDLECLNPREYLNDNIIDFYLQYIMLNSISREVREKTHIFTTFFFTKLTGGKHDSPSQKDQSKKVYERVKKWLKKVDVFSKDYVVIPVNRSHHWFLVIVCNAHNVQQAAGSDDIMTIEDVPKTKSPCIIVMDSLGIVRTGGANKLTAPIRYALQEEWKNKRKDDKKFDHILIPDRTIKPPQQDNSYDCGLFLIKYVECFLKNPEKVLSSSTNKLGRDFLEVKDAKNLRKVIKDTIIDLWKRNQNSIVVESTIYGPSDDDGNDESQDDKSKIKSLNNGKNGKVEPVSGPSHQKYETVSSDNNPSDSDMEIIETSVIEVTNKKEHESTVDLCMENDSITITPNVKDDIPMTDDEEEPITSKKRNRSASKKDDLNDDAEILTDTTKEMKDENKDLSNKSIVIDISTEEDSTKKSNETDELHRLIS